MALNKQTKMMWAYLTTAAISLLLNLALIPIWSYYGASIASVISEFIIMLWAMIIVHKTTGSFVNLKKLPKIILASGLMGLMLWLANGLNVLILISLGGLVYCLSLILLKAIDKKTISAIIHSS